MGNITVSGAVAIKAGANVSSTLNTEYEDYFIPQAEALLNTTVRYNFSDNFSNLNADVSEIVKMGVEAKAAMMAILYDMSGYTNRREAETMLDVLDDEYDKAIKELKEQSKLGFVKSA